MSLPEQVANQLVEYISTLSNRSLPVVDLATPDELKETFASVGCPVPLPDASPPHDDLTLMRAVNLILQKSVRTGHPHFYNQLYGRVNLVSMCGDWISTTTNTNGHTFEAAPVATLFEVELLSKFSRCIGGRYLLDGTDGLFVPGGSSSNQYAMHLARDRADPEAKRRGHFGGKRLVAYTSAAAHYSFLKAVRLVGIGTDNLRKISSHPNTGVMDVNELHAAILEDIEKGYVPFFVGSTAGTTVLGSFDNFHAIASLCEKFHIWHHVDACWGGAAILSKLHRSDCDGVERSDSLAWNPHKMLGCALQTSLLLVSGRDSSSDDHDKHQLETSNGSKATYLFQPDKLNVEYDLGDKSLQCGRKTDSLKLWMMWKSMGDVGMEASVDKCYALREYMEASMRRRSLEKKEEINGWIIVAPPSCTNLCFWYVPTKCRPYNPTKDKTENESVEKERKEKMHAVAPAIKATMQREGRAMIGFQTDVTIENGDVNFFRMVFASCDTVEESDIDQVLDDIAKIGETV